jgi:hypothetical protein
MGNNSLQSPTSTPLDTFRYDSSIHGNLSAISAAKNSANKMNSWAAKSFTSNASDTSARQLEAMSKGIDVENQGRLADKVAIDESRQRAE